MNRIIEKVNEISTRVEQARVEVMEQFVTSEDLRRVASYPISAHTPVEAERREFGDGLARRLHKAAS